MSHDWFQFRIQMWWCHLRNLATANCLLIIRWDCINFASFWTRRWLEIVTIIMWLIFSPLRILSNLYNVLKVVVARTQDFFKLVLLASVLLVLVAELLKNNFVCFLHGLRFVELDHQFVETIFHHTHLLQLLIVTRGWVLTHGPTELLYYFVALIFQRDDLLLLFGCFGLQII